MHSFVQALKRQKMPPPNIGQSCLANIKTIAKWKNWIVCKRSTIFHPRGVLVAKIDCYVQLMAWNESTDDIMIFIRRDTSCLRNGMLSYDKWRMSWAIRLPNVLLRRMRVENRAKVVVIRTIYGLWNRWRPGMTYLTHVHTLLITRPSTITHFSNAHKHVYTHESIVPLLPNRINATVLCPGDPPGSTNIILPQPIMNFAPIVYVCPFFSVVVVARESVSWRDSKQSATFPKNVVLLCKRWSSYPILTHPPKPTHPPTHPCSS